MTGEQVLFWVGFSLASVPRVGLHTALGCHGPGDPRASITCLQVFYEAVWEPKSQRGGLWSCGPLSTFSTASFCLSFSSRLLTLHPFESKLTLYAFFGELGKGFLSKGSFLYLRAMAAMLVPFPGAPDSDVLPDG